MSFGAAPPGMDEYQRLMADRAAAQKRKQLIFGVVAVAAVGGGVFFYKRDRDKKTAAQEILDAAGRFAERDKTEMGAFWNCAMSSEVDVGMFNSADQIQQRIESAYFTQQKTYSEHLTTECIPRLEGARAALASLLTDVQPALRPPLEKYVAALPAMQTGLESYAEKLKTRSSVKDVDGAIQDIGGAFTAEVSPESVAFEKFLVCAIPDLDKKKDLQAVLEGLADICKKDPVPFMTKVRTDCGQLVQNVDKTGKPSPSKTFKANTKKLVEEDNSRMLGAWEYCGKRSRKGKKQIDLEDFLLASSDYMEARSDVVKTAREEAARITGQPLTQEKSAGAPAAE
jgi:hypothetical protein